MARGKGRSGWRGFETLPRQGGGGRSFVTVGLRVTRTVAGSGRTNKPRGAAHLTKMRASSSVCPPGGLPTAGVDSAAPPPGESGCPCRVGALPSRRHDLHGYAQCVEEEVGRGRRAGVRWCRVNAPPRQLILPRTTPACVGSGCVGGGVWPTAGHLQRVEIYGACHIQARVRQLLARCLDQPPRAHMRTAGSSGYVVCPGRRVSR